MSGDGVFSWLMRRDRFQRRHIGEEAQLHRSIYAHMDPYTARTCDDETNFGGVYNLEFSPDGTILVAACEKKSVTLFDPMTYQPTTAITEAHRDCVNCIKFLDERMFATCSDDSTIALWDTRNLSKKLRSLNGHMNWVKNIEYSNQDSLLVTSGFDGSVFTWDINSYTEQSLVYNKVFHMSGLMRCRISPDASKLVISTTGGYMIIIHNLDLHTLAKDMAGFRPNIYRLMQMGHQYIPFGASFEHIFTRKRNRVEFASDFPDGNDAEVICSLQIHPQGWCALSRNISYDESTEWTTVHDIQEWDSSSEEDDDDDDSDDDYDSSSDDSDTVEWQRQCAKRARLQRQASTATTSRRPSILASTRQAMRTTAAQQQQQQQQQPVAGTTSGSASAAGTSASGSAFAETSTSSSFSAEALRRVVAPKRPYSVGPTASGRVRRRLRSPPPPAGYVLPTLGATVSRHPDIWAAEVTIGQRYSTAVNSAARRELHTASANATNVYGISSGMITAETISAAQAAERSVSQTIAPSTTATAGRTNRRVQQTSAASVGTTPNTLVIQNEHRLLNYIEEPNKGKGFIKELCFSADGRMICSPYGLGIRLLAFSPECDELPATLNPDGRARPLTVLKYIKCHSDIVVSTKFSPKMPLLASGCLNGKVVWHQPTF